MIKIQAKRVERLVRAYHEGIAGPEQEDAIVTAFGIPRTDDLPLAELARLHRQYGLSNYIHEATAIEEIREIFRAINLAPGHCFMDIGAGYGAVVLYGAALTRARFCAVEAVPGRAVELARAARRLGFDHVEVMEQGAGDVDHSRADFVFLNNPFLGEENRRYLRRLRGQIRRSCRVIAINNIVAEFRQSPDFAELRHSAAIAEYKFGLFAPA
ncbi:hypothetical protein [uncultured Hoeflea sp.]|uniref:hypothetical protein n=1 Tax=uncultured Hoeflea sp. TaxID=538666 RepID=UPI00262400C0|nr:hypothetical protein [uncultured Hoeflea sp.]